MTNVPHYIKTSQLICNANQLTGFYMMGNIDRQWVNGVKTYQFKAKDSNINVNRRQVIFCLGNISKDFTIDNLKKTGLNGYVYDSNIDYNTIYISDIVDIHKYLMKKNNIK